MENSVASTLEAYFDAIWVLSLKRSADRHAHLARDFPPLKYEMVWAEDGAAYTLEEIQKKAGCDLKESKRYTTERRALRRREVACAWSHRKLYERVVRDNLRRVLILEDDAAPANEGLKRIQPALDSLPSDWEFCYFGYFANEQCDRADLFKQRVYRITQSLGITNKIKYKVGRQRYPRPYNEYVQRPGFHYGSHAYAVTQSACRKLIARQTPIVLEADRVFSELILQKELNAFSVRTKAFTNRSSEKEVPSVVFVDKSLW